MAKKVEATGMITDSGEFKIYNNQYFKAKTVNTFKGRKIKIVIVEDKPIVTTRQLSYYFGVMVKLIQEEFKDRGDKFSQGEIDDFLRLNFLYEEKLDPISGEMKKKGMRLNAKETTVSTVRKMQFWEDVQQWAVEKLDLNIPGPNEDVKNEMLENSINNHK